MSDTDFLSPAAAYSNTLETLMLQREKSAMEMAKLQMEREKHQADIEDSRQDRELRRMLLQQQQQDRRDAQADKKTAAEAAVEEKQRTATANMLANQKMGDVLMPEDAERAEKFFPGRLVNPKQPLRDFAETLPIGSPERAGVQAQLTTPPLETMVKERVPLRYIGLPAERAKADVERQQRQFIASSPEADRRALEADLLGFSAKAATQEDSGVFVNLGNDVQNVLEGRDSLLNIRQGMGRTNDAARYMAALRRDIDKIDPDFDFNLSNAGTKAVSSQFYQKSMVAVNSLLPNLDTFKKLSAEVPRLGIRGVDDLIQRGQMQFGNKKVTSLRQMQLLIGDEIGIALGAGNVSDMKLKLGLDVTDPAVSTENFAQNIDNVKHFVENRKAGLEALRYSSATTKGPNETGGAGGGGGGLPATKVFPEGPYKGRTGYLRPDGKTYSLTPPERPNEAAAPTGAAAVPVPAPVVVPPPPVVAPPPPVALPPVAPAFEGGKLASADEMMPPPGVPVVRRSSVPPSIPAPAEPTIPPILRGANRPLASSPLAPQPVAPGPAPTTGTLRLAPPPGRMRLSPEGAATLKGQREGGFYGEPYEDQGTGLAIGYGMHYWKGKPVTADLRITEREADLEFERQVAMDYGPQVDKALKVPVTQAQYDALVSVAWNSPGAMRTLAAKLNRGERLTREDFQASATLNRVPHKGLQGRRSQEFAPFAE